MKIGDLVALPPDHLFHDIGVGLVVRIFKFSQTLDSPEYCTVLFSTGESYSPLTRDLVLVRELHKDVGEDVQNPEVG